MYFKKLSLFKTSFNFIQILDSHFDTIFNLNSLFTGPLLDTGIQGIAETPII